jgi:orotate phosphoribosyltransferase
VGADDALEMLRARGAVRSGHFLLSSGSHSDVYVEKARMFEDAAATMRLGTEIASWYGGIEAVVSPAVGALPLGFAVAAAAGARFLYAERQDGAMTLRRGFTVEPGERVLVVEDVVTTGGSAAEVHDLVRTAGADVAGVAALVDRSVSRVPFSLRAMARVEARVFDPERCPMCEGGLPIESPGSRHLPASPDPH